MLQESPSLLDIFGVFRSSRPFVFWNQRRSIVFASGRLALPQRSGYFSLHVDQVEDLEGTRKMLGESKQAADEAQDNISS